MNAILQIIFAGLFPTVALAMFTTWWTATILVISIIIFIKLYVKNHNKQFDDRLSKKRMDQALEWYIKEVKNQD